MHNEVLEKYLNDPKVLYIYETGLQIYGLFDDIEDRDFIIICTDDYVPEGFELSCDCGTEFSYFEENEFGKYNYKMYPVKKWFEDVLNNSIEAWECACLSKKFIYKEHVKLVLQTNPLQLRKTFETDFNTAISIAKDLILDGNSLTGQKLLWNIVKYVMFSNQIIENHKIVKFKEPLEAYKQIVDGQVSDLDTIFQTFDNELQPHLKRFKKYTDGMLAKSKIKIINQNA